MTTDARRAALIASGAVVVAIVGFFALVEAIPQDPAYHRFVDTREFFGIANFFNVMSNLPFLFAGGWGLAIVARRGFDLPFGVFFAGVTLTAFGSGWYHLEPNNLTLTWDRLPMTIAFAGLAAAIVADYFSRPAATPLLYAFLVAGVSSVFYWRWTEMQGAGDLRAYAVAQFLPMLAIPIVLLRLGARSPLTRYYWYMIGWYLLAKVFEFFDAALYAGEILSGHTLKHIAAATGAGALAWGLSTHWRSDRGATI